jgi:hypothetical protein
MSLRAALVPTVLLCASAVHAAESQYSLTVNADGVAYEVLVNGKTIAKEDPNATTSQGIPINKYLVVGEHNKVEVKLHCKVAKGTFSYEVAEASTKKTLVKNRWTLDKPGQDSTYSSTFDVAKGVVLAKQMSIFPEPAPPAANIKLYGMVADAKEGVWATLKLNGVEVAHADGTGGTTSGGALTGWLMPGENVFELEVTKVTPGKEAAYAFTLHGLAEPGFPDDSNKIFGFNWPSAGTTAAPGKSSYKYKVVAAPPSLLWSKAAVLSEISADDRKQIGALVEQLATAMRAKDAKKVVTLWKWKFDDMSRAAQQPIDPAELGQLEQMFDAMLKDKTLKLTIAPTAQARYTLVAGNRVVSVTGPKGEVPIAGKMKDGALNMDVYVAKIDGAWTLVR